MIITIKHRSNGTIAKRRLYRAEGQVGRPVARMLGGRSSDAPTWSLLRRAVTVHGLGGVPMGVDREQE